ncbi:hypothetical protein PAECIP111802_06451 [Paenibacillus allorhizosphaerae]|uniref:Transposase n=1 Tax=Paenibacillus allorhizosphaerae TaxID=2849866 RepID=A0ABM8VSK8_9BACL|nr:hypothetical protein PAECIP111802_06451 [Paenibacillus allorhizosphaerae]
MVDRAQIIRFISDAEHAWENVVFSFDRRQTPVRIGGFDYYRLPLKYATRAKIFTFYRKYWSTVYANRMICSEFKKYRRLAACTRCGYRRFAGEGASGSDYSPDKYKSHSGRRS